ncbi:MAG: M20 family metallopeptidase [Gaiellaceae bacterium]
MSSLGNIEALKAEPTLSQDFVTEVLASLVKEDSRNEPGVYEAGMAARVARWLEPTAATVTMVESLPGRPSVGAVIEGSGEGPRLVLNGHMDTHPLDDLDAWTTDPTGAEIRDGYMYGRGSCDMKAGLTAQIAVAHYLSKHAAELKGSLVLHFAIGEERGEPGTRSLVEAGFVGEHGVVTEPTELRVAAAERGTAWYTIRINGRSIHASRAHLGVNPMYRLGAVLDVIKSYDEEAASRPHALLPGGSCTPGLVSGGVKENSVPDYCEITVDRRLLPGETVDGEMETIRQLLEPLKQDDPDFDFEISRYRAAFEAAEIDHDSAFAAKALAAAAEVSGTRTELWGTPFSSDIGDLVNAGIEAITFGPGYVAECHCADERVELAQVRDAAQVLAKLACDTLT